MFANKLSDLTITGIGPHPDGVATHDQLGAPMPDAGVGSSGRQQAEKKEHLEGANGRTAAGVRGGGEAARNRRRERGTAGDWNASRQKRAPGGGRLVEHL